MAVITREGFAKRLLNSFDLQVSQRRMNALIAWQTAEGTAAKFNPLATTRRMPGSIDFNSIHVQEYSDLPTGITATRLTLEEQGHKYEPIVFALQDNAPAKQILEAVAASSWGTGNLALAVLPYVKEQYDRYANQPIGQ